MTTTRRWRRVGNYSKIQFTIDLSITNDSFTSSPHLGLFDGSFRNPFHILPQISFKILLYFDLFTQIGENKRVIVVRQLTLLPPHSPRHRPWFSLYNNINYHPFPLSLSLSPTAPKFHFKNTLYTHLLYPILYISCCAPFPLPWDSIKYSPSPSRAIPLQYNYKKQSPIHPRLPSKIYKNKTQIPYVQAAIWFGNKYNNDDGDGDALLPRLNDRSFDRRWLWWWYRWSLFPAGWIASR